MLTGHARANYVPSVGEPHLDESDSNSNADHESGVAAVLRYKLEDGPLFESNNVPYLPMLDLGHSKRAPAGFIETAIDQAVATIQGRYNNLQIDLPTTGAGTFSDYAGGLAAGNLAEAYMGPPRRSSTPSSRIPSSSIARPTAWTSRPSRSSTRWPTRP